MQISTHFKGHLKFKLQPGQQQLLLQPDQPLQSVNPDQINPSNLHSKPKNDIFRPQTHPKKLIKNFKI